MNRLAMPAQLDDQGNPLFMEFLSTPSAMVPSGDPGSPVEARDLAKALDLLTHQAQSELGNLAQTAFFMGDGAQRALVDGFYKLFLPRTWAPNNLLRRGTDAVRQTAQLLQLLQPEQANLAWQELRNKLEVFILVKNLPSILQLPSDQLRPLPELVDKAYSIDPFQALWAVEGLGHYYADMYWKYKGPPRGLLSENQPLIPTKSLLMLHAGMGLSFGDRLLGELTSEATEQQVRVRIEYFLELCRTNSCEGYQGAAIESLGLVSRDFYPDLVRRVERQLQQVGPEFLGFFWHGVGRAMYFSRAYFLPVLRSVWSGVDSEAHNAPDRLSATAGLSWAVAMVNLRQPAIVENVLRSLRGQSFSAAGFTNGIVSSLIMRADTTPDAPFTRAFYQHQPDAGDHEMKAAWDSCISLPVEQGLGVYYPVLLRHHALDHIFRYQDLAALVSSVQQQNTGAESPAYRNRYKRHGAFKEANCNDRKME
jgi:hypothetical protein